MAYQVTARKWRPRKFDEVVGQEHITTTLKNAIGSGRLAQCYLFCGPRGVGKTTTARILSKALNCPDREGADPCDECASCRSIAEGTSMNVLEIDGASNNSVEDVRELREVVRYAATEGRYKIYIIDEVHMLSTAAFNALLKTLEEPPAHVVFVFATTEVQEVPETILSRCQRFNFRRIPAGRIAAHLQTIAGAEGIEADEEGLYLLASRADGALRDAESLFDQVVSFGEKVSAQSVRQVLGLVEGELYFELIEALAQAAPQRALDLVGQAVEAGIDVEEFTHGLVEEMRALLFARVQGGAARLEVAESLRPRYEELADRFAEEDLLRALQVLLDLQSELRRSLQPRFRLEAALVRLALMGRAVEVGQLLARLQQLESGLRSGAPAADSRPQAPSAAPARRPAPPAQAESQKAPARPEPQRVSARVESQGAPPAKAGEQGTPAKGAAEGALSLEKLRRDWSGLVGDVRGEQPALAIFLENAALLELDGKVLRLGFQPEDRFPMSRVSSNRESLEALCRRRWGQELRIDCQVLGEEESNGREAEPPPPEADPTLRSVLDAFDGELV